MTAFNKLLAADEARRKAMIDADVNAMNTLFHEDLTWTHSSGRTDGRQQLTDTLVSGDVVYQSIENNDVTIRQHGHIYLVTGELRGEVLKDGAPKRLHNRFLSVWQEEGGDYRMLAWQSTGL